MLSKEQILNAKDIETVKVEVPEWRGYIYLKPLTGTERDNYESRCVIGKEMKNYKDLRASLAVASICDENGSRIFEDKDIQDLNKKSALVLERLSLKVLNLSGLSEDAVEELEKN